LSSLVKKNGPLEIERAVDYVLQAARGLSFAHRKGVVHRDIKPANLLLDGDGVVKILDMGLARIENNDDGLTATEQVMGTVDYMSPEQAANTKGVDGRADVYSLGCTLWYLLTGKKVYEADTMIARLMAHRDGPLPSLVKTRDDAPWSLEQVFHKMIAKRADDRYQTMDEVVAALEPFAPSGGSRSGMGSSIGSGPQNAELSAFLKTVGPAVKSQMKPAPTGTKVDFDATAQFAAAEAGTDPKSQVLPSPNKATGAKPQAKASGGAKGPPVKLIVAGIGGFALLVALGVWLLIKDQDGNEVARVQVPEGGTATVVTAPPAAELKTTVAVPAAKTMLFAELLDLPDYVWTEPENLGPPVNGPGGQNLLCLTNDQLRLYFHRKGGPDGKNDEVCEVIRPSLAAPFGEPRVVASGAEASVSGDGLTLVRGAPDMTMRRRPSLDAPFGEAIDLGPQVNSPADERRPTLSPDGQSLVFSSDRPGGAGGLDLWISRRKSSNDSFGPAEKIGGPVNTPGSEPKGFVLADGQTLLFLRGGSWHSTFTSPTGVPGAIALREHPFGYSGHLWIAPDGRTAYFSADRPDGLGDQDIWVTRRVPKAGASRPSPLAPRRPSPPRRSRSTAIAICWSK